MATSLGLNERLFVVNPQEVHELVGTGRMPGPGRELCLRSGGGGGGASGGLQRVERGPGSGCCWALSGERMEWASADGGIQGLGVGRGGELAGSSEGERGRPAFLVVFQGTDALQRAVPAMGGCQEDASLGSPS